MLQNTHEDAALTAVVLLLRISLNDDVFYLETYMSEHEQKAKYLLGLRESFFLGFRFLMIHSINV